MTLKKTVTKSEAKQKLSCETLYSEKNAQTADSVESKAKENNFAEQKSPFATQSEEKQFKKWLKDTLFGVTGQKLFDAIKPSEADLLTVFREEKQRSKAKKFLPFKRVFQETFFQQLPEDLENLTETQRNFIAAMNWHFIVNKIEDMNVVLEKSYTLFDNGDIIHSLELLEELANAGHPEACYLMSVYAQQDFLAYEIVKNPEKAFLYANKALEFVEHPRACLVLAGLYNEGIGVEADKRQAVSWVLKAERSAESDPSVFSYLAEYYQDGYIVQRDVEKAAFYAQKADS